MTAVAENNVIQGRKSHHIVDYQAITTLNDVNNKFSWLQIRWPCQYRGEGNSNIVLALYEGTQVIRLPKIKVGDVLSGEDSIRERKKLEREVIFANEVFGPIIGPEFIGPVNIVKISPEQIAELNEQLKVFRPANRLHKELGVPFATSHEDFARINLNGVEHVDFCIEVKPKQGWWGKSLLGQPTDLCTFCSNQYLKLKLGKVTSHSAYCPLDLFSGDPLRMVLAVTSLIQTPQNNLRIFRNGVKVYGDNLCERECLETILNEWFSISNCDNIGASSESSLLNEKNILNFVFVTCMALLKPMLKLGWKTVKTHGVYTTFEKQLKEFLQQSNILSLVLSTYGKTKLKPCNNDFTQLPEGSVLSRILYAQKLGKWGSGRVYDLYSKICPVHILATQDENVNCPSSDCLSPVEDKWLDEIKYSLNEVDLLCVEHYLLATTAKDCSILISYSPANVPYQEIVSKEILIDLYGRSHVVKIGVADLDPKPITSIARHYVRDREVNDAYRN